jgi:hypothetical protein
MSRVDTNLSLKERFCPLAANPNITGGEAAFVLSSECEHAIKILFNNPSLDFLALENPDFCRSCGSYGVHWLLGSIDEIPEMILHLLARGTTIPETYSRIGLRWYFGRASYVKRWHAVKSGSRRRQLEGEGRYLADLLVHSKRPLSLFSEESL